MGRLENVGKIEERRAMVGYKLQIARLPTMKAQGAAKNAANNAAQAATVATSANPVKKATTVP